MGSASHRDPAGDSHPGACPPPWSAHGRGNSAALWPGGRDSHWSGPSTALVSPLRHWFPSVGCGFPQHRGLPSRTQPSSQERCQASCEFGHGVTVSSSNRSLVPPAGQAMHRIPGAGVTQPSWEGPVGAMSWEPHTSLPPLSLCHPGDTIFVQNALHICSAAAGQGSCRAERGG